MNEYEVTQAILEDKNYKTEQFTEVKFDDGRENPAGKPTQADFSPIENVIIHPAPVTKIYPGNYKLFTSIE